MISDTKKIECEICGEISLDTKQCDDCLKLEKYINILIRKDRDKAYKFFSLLLDKFSWR